MKTSLKILLLAVTLAAMTGCSAQKRAERHLRRAVELCPEIVQAKAHVVDTVLTVGLKKSKEGGNILKSFYSNRKTSRTAGSSNK